MSKQNILGFIRLCLYIAVVLVPLVFIQRTMFPFLVVKTSVFQVLTAVVVLLWAVLAVFYKQYRPRFTPLLAAVGGLLVWLTITSVTGSDWRVSLWSNPWRAIGVIQIWHFGLLFLAVSSLWREIKWEKMWVLSLGTSVVASLGALFAFLPAVGAFLLTPGAERPGSTFGNPIFLAGYLLFHVFLALLPFFGTYDKKWRWFGAAVAAVNIGAIAVTQTRGDLLGLAVGALVLLAYLAFKRFRSFSTQRSLIKNPALYVLAILILGAAFFAVAPRHPVWQYVPGVSRVDVTQSVDSRLMAWEIGLEAWKEKPLLGWGWENFNIALERHYNPEFLKWNFGETFWDKPHNLFIEYLVAGGLLGLLGLLAVLVLAMYQVFTMKDRRFRWLLASLLVAYAVRSFFVFDTIGTYLLAYLVLAFIDGAWHAGRAHPHEGQALGVKYFMPAAWSALAAAAVLSYFISWPMFRAMNLEHGGPNYFLFQKLESSLESFNAALAVKYNPYRDETRRNFAGTVKQAYAQGLSYPEIENLHVRLMEEMDKTISRHPLDYNYYTFQAEMKNQFVAFDRKYLDEADELTRKALELSPGRQQVYYVIAKTRLLRGDQQGAFDAFQTAIGFYSEAGDPHFYLGLLAYQMGNNERGRQELARARELGRQPNTAEEAIAAGSLVGDGDGNYEAALQYYERALQLSTKHDEQNNIRFKMAVAYYLGGRYPEAKALFEELGKIVNYRRLPIFPDLQPALDQLGVPY